MNGRVFVSLEDAMECMLKYLERPTLEGGLPEPGDPGSMRLEIQPLGQELGWKEESGSQEIS